MSVCIYVYTYRCAEGEGLRIDRISRISLSLSDRIAGDVNVDGGFIPEEREGALLLLPPLLLVVVSFFEERETCLREFSDFFEEEPSSFFARE